ncbi:hypothetical protein [Rhodanobacter sp. C03]|uniref:hypothetical protein n=1 Tax=Rhodanobacter sp. C03 TaxID=1945858 RepID=UPI0009863434|nr:hypothetical protein [Rhodanobacter sp. C03]OOG59827.1 hypothetical protein B0E48_03295 [Rhodanobacter sp. C03]
MFSPLIHRLQECWPRAISTTISRRWLRLAPILLVRNLPALGSVLYVQLQSARRPTRQLPRGLLIESMQLAPLLQGHRLMAASTITVEGPREWIECIDRDGRPSAQLHLLPDTDYLAWDALLSSAKPLGAPSPACRSHPCRPVAAQLLCFHMRRLAGLDVLGAETTTRVSALSRQLVAQIAREEAQAWQPTTRR